MLDAAEAAPALRWAAWVARWPDEWVAANDEFTPHSFVANVTGWRGAVGTVGPGAEGVPSGCSIRPAA
ncbi:MAG: hypothetical protein R2755_27270 [Acidimicrobiales bacterium]